MKQSKGEKAWCVDPDQKEGHAVLKSLGIVGKGSLRRRKRMAIKKARREEFLEKKRFVELQHLISSEENLWG